MAKITDIVAEYALKHSTTRSVTLRKVLVRLIEQHDNLKEYFLTFLHTTCSFKANVEKSKWYERICESLNDNSALCYLSFVAYFSSDFESFLTRFQSLKPLIHILHEEMETLLWNVMAKFVKSKYLTNKKDGEKWAVSANELLLVQTTDKNVVKNLKNIDVGTKAKGLFFALCSRYWWKWEEVIICKHVEGQQSIWRVCFHVILS